MDLVLLTETIVKKLVNDSDAVSVREVETIDEDIINIQITVANDDLGKVIGRDGKTIKSIRNIIFASAALNGLKKVKVDVDSYE